MLKESIILITYAFIQLLRRGRKPDKMLPQFEHWRTAPSLASKLASKLNANKTTPPLLRKDLQKPGPPTTTHPQQREEQTKTARRIM